MSSNLILLLFAVDVLSISTIPLENKSTRHKRLVKTSEFEPPKWLDEEDILVLIKTDQDFMDITDLDSFPENALEIQHPCEITTELRYQTIVSETFTSINITRIKDFITFFSRFFNRYCNDAFGVQSEQWLLSQINSSVEGYLGRISVTEYAHSHTLQSSIIARIEGSDPILGSEVIVLGAHQDTINSDGPFLGAPGADDNASGCSVLLEVLRVIIENDIVLKRTVEFHWYAGEEKGLRGSLDIAETYRENGVNVAGMINFDMVGSNFGGNDEIAIITDYVDSQLTQFLRILVDEYLDFGRRERECGYGCSDHAVWTRNGYPASRATQAVKNINTMHTVNDTFDTISFVQVREFVKLAIGFLIELAEPITNS